MGASEPSDAVVVRLDPDLAREIVAESRPEDVRLAPSLRGGDLVEVGAVILVSTGAAADGLTLILARRHISKFAQRVADLVRRRKTAGQSGRLIVELESSAAKMSVDLETADSSRLADVLRTLADAADATGLQGPSSQ